MTSVHHAYDTRILHRQCLAAIDAGMKVILIAPHRHDEHYKGVHIKSVQQIDNPRRRLLVGAINVLKLALRERGDVYQFHDPELIPVGVVLSLLGKKVIYDVHEEYTKDFLTKEWIPRKLRRPASLAISLLEKAAQGFFSGIVAATPTIANQFPPSKTITVQNFPKKSELSSMTSLPYSERGYKIIYIGNITEIRGIREMVTSVNYASNKLAAPLSLELGGSFSPLELREAVLRIPGWHNVNYWGFLNRDEVAEIMGTARIGLLLFHPTPNHLEALPNKLFEYMSVGIPIIASNFPLWTKIINETRCGLVVNPKIPQETAEAIEYLINNQKEAEAMGYRGQEAVENIYSWEPQAQKLIALYRSMQ
ncbi:glycosyltransferase [Deinococcus detaillensis]|nr:glycosyltransferase [Deinococcus detaillensis]